MKPYPRAPLLMAVLALAATAAAAAEKTLSVDLGKGVKLEMVLVPKGTFVQGSPSGEQGRNDDETERQVTLTKDFYLGKFPVTVGQFRRFVEESRYRTEAEVGTSGGSGFDGKGLVQRKDFTWRNPGFPQGDDHPVTLVTFADAQAFAAWLAGKAHRQVILPTEAQWEYACRAGTTTRFYSGDAEDHLREIGWYGANSGNGTRPVGQKKPNALGLYDMSGNVYEWCRDWYAPYEGAKATDPEQTRSDRGQPPRRVLRGGSWMKEERHCRSAARFRNTPGSRNADNGFRVAARYEIVAEREEAGPAGPPRPPLVAQLPGAEGAAKAAPAAQGPGAPSAPPVAVKVPPPRAPRSHGVAFPCLGVACAALGVLLVIALAVLFWRQGPKAALARDRRRRPREPGRGPSPGALVPEPADDGFWLDLANISPGSTVRYRCRLFGAVREHTVVTEPGPRQFVYTGASPTEITILEIIPPGGSLGQPRDTILPAEAVDQDRPLPPPPRPAPESRDTFTGFPSAYH